MQDNTNLDAMAKKYKEEMMRIYNAKRPAAEASAPAAAKKYSTENIQPAANTVNSASVVKNPEADAAVSEAVRENTHTTVTTDTSAKNHLSEADKSRLMNPPMPQIPNTAEKCEKSVKPSMPEIKSTAANTENTSESRIDTARLSTPPMPKIPVQTAADNGYADYSSKPKFPTAEELIAMDGETVPETAQTRDARFESSPNGEHNQGNYDFSVFPDDEYKKEVSDFGGYDDDDLFILAQGYLQVEVMAENGDPIDSAAIVVTEKVGDMDTLVVTLVTDSEGKTEAVALPIPSKVKSCDYMITVYKEGYYTVYNLTVPIFDTIKSVQPVTLFAVEK